MLFFNTDFWRFRARFWNLLGLQVRRAARSARRVKSHCIICLPEHTAFPSLGEAPESQDPAKTQGRSRPCWGHVGTFFALGRLLFALGRFLYTFWRFWPIVDVFFGFLVALDSILQALGQVLEPSNLHFSIFLGVSQHKSQKCSSCNKTTVFAMFDGLWNMSHTATERVFCIASKAWLDMVHGLLQKILAAIHFLLFKTTLQRGGTCEAH